MGCPAEMGVFRFYKNAVGVSSLPLTGGLTYSATAESVGCNDCADPDDPSQRTFREQDHRRFLWERLSASDFLDTRTMGLMA
jgi:hypothetical protein